MEVERATYVKIFNEDWETHGQMWCEARERWIRIKGKVRERKTKPGDIFYDAGSGLFDDTVNEKLLGECPYIVEHTVNAGA
jgi:hypothetical protein